LKNIIISILITLIGIAGYFAYKYYKDIDSMNSWDFVPQNSVGVYESTKINEILEEIDSIFLFSKIQSIITNNSSTKPSNIYLLKDFFDKTHTLISLHITSNSTIDVLFLLDLSNNKSEKLKEYLGKVRIEQNYTHSVRKYKDVDIHEIVKGGESISYVFYKGIFISSSTSYLVEDAIRTVLDKNLNSIRENSSELFAMPKLKNDDGNVYMNGEKINELINIFIMDDVKHPFLKSVFYDLNVDTNKLLLNGFAFDRSSLGLNTFNKQAPIPINIFDYIPNETLYLYHLGIENSEQWLSKIKIDKDSLNLKRLYKWVGNEIAIFETGISNENIEKVLFVKTTDINEALNHINILAESNVDPETDSLYFELYANYEIKELQIKEFPFQAFGNKFKGFEQSFYFVLDDYVVMSNSIYAIKKLLNSIEIEETWGRSIGKSKFLESTLKEANVSLFFNMPKMWEKLYGSLDDSWKKVIEDIELQNSISNGAIQFSNVDDKFYSSIVLELNNKKEKVKGSYDIVSDTYFESKVITKPFIVKNHNNFSFETLVQDSLTQLYLVDHKGDVLWKDSIGDIIVGKIHQIDYYKNKKLQYFFATSSQLHLIDRKGNYVEGFPKQLNFSIEQVSVVDYDNSKNYRFIVEDGEGRIYTYDKMLTNLEGWSPRKIDGKLSEPVKHVRVRGRDYMIAIQKNGQVNIMNRRGEFEKGFPLKLDMNIESKMFVSVGSNSKTTTITLLSTEGKLITFNINGEVVDRKELYKPSKETKFKISVSRSIKSFVIYRIDNNRLAILDKEGNMIFEKDYLNANIKNIQNYDFGVGNKIYAVNIDNQHFTYVYNHDGELLNSTPLNSNFEIGLLDYSSSLNKTMVYTCYNNHLTIYSY